MSVNGSETNLKKIVILDKWDGGIPKICHQMWLDIKQEDSNRVPSKYTNHLASFGKHNPHIRHQLWNLRMVKLMFLNEPKLERWKDFWMNQMHHHIERCDFARYAILYVIGGVYIDLDVWTLRNWDKLLNHRTFGIAWEPQEHSALPWDNISRRLWNGFICSVPGNPLLAEVMDYIVKNYNGLGPMQTTGPCMWARFMHKVKKYPFSNRNILENTNPQPSNIFIPTCEIIPVTDHGKVCNLCPSNALEKAYTVTYWHEGNGWGNNSVQDEKVAQELMNSLPTVQTIDIFDFFPEWNPEDICPDLALRLLKNEDIHSPNSDNTFSLYLSLFLCGLALVLLICLLVFILKKTKKPE